MNQNTHPFHRLLCLLMVLTLLLSATGCVATPVPTITTAPTAGSTPTTQPTEPTQPPTEPAQPPTEPTRAPTEPTQPPTQPPTEPTQPPTEPTLPPLDPRLPVYELKQEDVEEFYALLEECEALSLAGEDMETIEASAEALDDMYAYFGAQCSIAQLLHYSDTTNAFLEEQYLTCSEIYSTANKDYIEMVRRIYQSDSPAKEKLFEDWTEQDIAMLLAYQQEIAELQLRNTQIGVQYRATDKDSVRIPLYIELVQNNNKIAQTYGYDNYYEYAYEQVYSRDYSREELAAMRQYTKTHLAGSLDAALNGFNDIFYGLTMDKQLSIVNFLYEDHTTLYVNYLDYYLQQMPQSLQEQMNTMLTADSFFTNSTKAEAAAFTTMIGERSYCFFGPGYTNISTVVHEGGHYYASRYTDLNGLPLDLAETHSQGNEWLFMHTIKGKMSQDQYEALLNYRLYNDVAMLLVCLMVDEFEQRVYSTDTSNFTASDFDAMMDEVCSQYCTLEYAAEYLADMHVYWRAVVVDQPVYYISYAVSSIASMDLYFMAQDNFDQAVAAYQALCEQPNEELGFLGNLQAAGLRGPFAEEIYIELAKLLGIAE